MPTVVLIRHGESAANAGGRASTSAADIPLTENGRRQAAEFAASVLTPPDFIIQSSFLRAKNTAEPLILKYPEIPKDTWDVEEFTFLNPSKCQGSSVDERRPMREAFFNRRDPEYCDGGGAESFANFVRRVRSFLDRVRRLKYNTIYVFTHYQFICLLQIISDSPALPDVDLLDKFTEAFKALSVPNCGTVSLTL
jgi:broad specificity phosphatase PhoE